EFWDTHDVGEYLNDFERIYVEFQLGKPKEENIVVRVQKPIKDRLERIARRKGLNRACRKTPSRVMGCLLASLFPLDGSCSCGSACPNVFSPHLSARIRSRMNLFRL